MKKMIDQLKPFLPVAAYDRASEFEDDSFEIVDLHTDEEIGTYVVNADGELISFTIFDETQAGSVTKEEIASIAEKFINIFHPNKKEYELSAILDLDNPYMVVYEKRDEKLGLYLHGIGFTVSIATNGQITHFHYVEGEYEVEYADVVVTKEEALKQYISQLDFELIIQQFDHEVYKNGDNHYHLAYNVIDDATDIPIDGSEPFSIREEHPFGPAIPSQDVPDKTIYEILGITSSYKKLDEKKDQGKRTEIWSKQTNVDSFSFDMDDPEEHVIKLCFDEKTGLLLQVKNGEEYDESNDELSKDNAQKHALNLMFKLFPDTNERFQLEDFEEEFYSYLDEGEDDDFMEEEDFDVSLDLGDEDMFDDYIEYEPTYTFYFHLHHKGIRMDQHASFIEVGKFTGKITNVELDIPEDELYMQLPTSPVISSDEAKEIYKKYLQMELKFIQEYEDESEKMIYKLSYVPEFPETVGHVRAIEAITGEAMYVDVGDATFL
ncbi:YcdB/YcdC domain-containing protein [Aquibacillus rhizosphaerae]|uniref:YcdB/YcdC repeated domain-containing protein n=1 Tax=Aquibacillus rhizosphaerae TaxID=3051431 RepID=A0ABT7L977_9BACI|nr:YcdB/YcdC domain-containing protein [Aquibacillus sp. LR5S19]MDL4842428.1 hypothetical protein [Aquibacillus sp. LR5S19]